LENLRTATTAHASFSKEKKHGGDGVREQKKEKRGDTPPPMLHIGNDDRHVGNEENGKGGNGRDV